MDAEQLKRDWEAKNDRRPIMAIVAGVLEGTGLKAEYLSGVWSVGVQGDAKTYTPVLVLVGPFPGSEKLAALSDDIVARVNINRVTFELARAGGK